MINIDCVLQLFESLTSLEQVELFYMVKGIETFKGNSTEIETYDDCARNGQIEICKTDNKQSENNNYLISVEAGEDSMVLLHTEEKTHLDINSNLQIHSENKLKESKKMRQFSLRKNALRQEVIPEERPDYFSKVVLLGDPCTGKTTLLNYLQCEECARKTNSSCISRFRHFVERIFNVSEKLVLTRIYDTAGQEKYRSLTASYYRGAHGCLILYDVTKESSFDNLNHWLHDLKEYTSQPEISTIIVGTKCHVPEDRREVTYERAQKYAESINLPYMEVSAEEGINITEVFEKLADLIIESLNKDTFNPPIQPKSVILDSKPTKRKQQWCSC